MKENKYDEERFFEKYSQMDRSRKGLQGAGEWPALEKMLPPFAGRDVLDLGCGYGWHCRYAPSTARRRCWERTFPKRCWPWPGRATPTRR